MAVTRYRDVAKASLCTLIIDHANPGVIRLLDLPDCAIAEITFKIKSCQNPTPPYKGRLEKFKDHSYVRIRETFWRLHITEEIDKIMSSQCSPRLLTHGVATVWPRQ